MSLGVTAGRFQSLARRGLRSRIARFRGSARGVLQPYRLQLRTYSRDLGNASFFRPHDHGGLVSALTRAWERSRSIPHVRCLTNSTSELAKPSAIEEASGRDLVLSPPALVVTREYEWANILVGFEQANKYTIRAAPGGKVVGYLAEVR